MEAVLLVGVQGSGKTTFYRRHFFDTHVRISRDMVKTPRRERLLLLACLEGRQPFVVDNTNALASRRAEWIGPARAAGFRVVGLYFRTELSEALRRNHARPGKARIPPAGLVRTFKQLQLPSWDEGFDELRVVRAGAEDEFVVIEWPRDRAEPPE